jgi:hypothetical protein
MSYTDVVICIGPFPFLETWPPIYRGQERTARDRLKASQVHHHVYFWYTPCLTDFTFEFIRRPTPPILSPSYWTFVKLTLVNETPPLLVMHYRHRESIPWYQAIDDIIIPLLTIQIHKFLKTWKNIVSVYNICVNNPLNIQNLTQNIQREMKKTNVTWIVSQKYKNKYHTIPIPICLFLFLFVYFKFGSETFRNCKKISCEHSHFLFNILRIL